MLFFSPYFSLDLLFTDVATVVFNRCLTTNEETDHVTREDRNLQVTFNYEFLEDDRDPPPGLLARLFCWYVYAIAFSHCTEFDKL